MRRTLIIVVPVLILATVLTWLALRGDADVRAIRKAFRALVEDVELAERQDMLRAGLSARRIGARCTDDVTVHIRGAGDRGRELRAIRIDWRSTEEGWKVRGVSSFETIRGPQSSP